MHKKIAMVLATAVAVSGMSLFSFKEPLLKAIGDYLIVQDNLQRSDIIDVISGPDHRADYGIELYQRGYGGTLFFTGGWCDTIQGVHAERARERALARGVPLSNIVADATEVKSTYDEALRLKAYVDQQANPIKSVTIVSDPYHMRRAQWAFHRVLGDDIELLMAPVPFEQSPYKHRWWDDPESAQMVRGEYLKLVYYLARYQFTSGPLQGWLASLDRE